MGDICHNIPNGMAFTDILMAILGPVRKPGLSPLWLLHGGREGLGAGASGRTRGERKSFPFPPVASSGEINLTTIPGPTAVARCNRNALSGILSPGRASST